MNSNDRDELDDLIDRALPGYSRADPLDGLEDRVLRRVQTSGAPRRHPWFYRLGFAIPALAAVLFACIALRMGWNSQSPATNTTPMPVVSAPQPSLPPAARAAAPKRDIGTGSRSLPKEEFFPARTPITAEERALVAWVGRAPAEAAQAFADLQERSAEPIAIQPIQIPPLQSDGAQ